MVATMNSLSLQHCALVCASLLLAHPNAALAERADRNKPVTIEANKGDINDLTQVSNYTGRVILTKGTLILRCDTLSIKQDPEGFQYGTCLGKPAAFRQKRDVPNQFIEGVSERIDYDGKLETAKFTGNANIKRIDNGKAADEVQGALIVYDGRTELYTIDGKDEGRIRITIQPKKLATDTPSTSPPASTGLRSDAKVSAPK
jgi:lipopolysaccharide export system protein LptA